MTLAEKLLLSLSRNPGSEDYEGSREAWTIDNALSELRTIFPNFMTEIKGKEILDFGCGEGFQVVSLAQNDAKHVAGIDINQKYLRSARNLAKQCHVDHKVEFSDTLNKSSKGRFDIVISQNSMEHFADPASILSEMKSALKKDGVIYITFGPPWFAPYGSHVQFFTKLPWVNIIFNEKTVMKVRSFFRNDGAMKYEEVESGLNKMTISKFERLLYECEMHPVRLTYKCVKGLDMLGRLPVLRELFINSVSCIVTK
jgi:SAM-dependent methyltransferase